MSLRQKSSRAAAKRAAATSDDNNTDSQENKEEQIVIPAAAAAPSPTPTASAAKKRKTVSDELMTDSPESGKLTPSLFTRPERPTAAFKNPNFVHSMKVEASGKRRVWKNLKQILAAERTMTWKPTDVTYASIEAPPSFYPAKKYSDISGLPAKYTDPQTKLRYSTPEEFAQIRTLPSDIIAGLLQLRKANNLMG